MRAGDKRRLAAGAAVLLAVAAGAALLFRGRGDDRAGAGGEAAGDGRRRWRGFAAGVTGLAGGADEGAAPEVPLGAAAKQQVETALAAWRQAILLKDADTVLALDRSFTGDPRRFAPALVKSAEEDQNERVRAFSTRVLGKLDAPALAELFQRLLDDKSPYVRQNAAWALGQLAGRTDGRQAAKPALAELRRVEVEDPAPDVRAAASHALDNLQ
jgi:hypothetical protein